MPGKEGPALYCIPHSFAQSLSPAQLPGGHVGGLTGGPSCKLQGAREWPGSGLVRLISEMVTVTVVSALRAAGPKLVREASPVRSPFSCVGGCCQHPPVMPTFEGAEDEHRPVLSAAVGGSSRAPIGINPHCGGSQPLLVILLHGGPRPCHQTTGLSCGS